MSIIGSESLVYGVDDLDTAIRFFTDFGLPIERRDAKGADFRLAEGSSVLIRAADDPALPAPFAAGSGPREIVWGVDSERALDKLGADLARDRTVRRDDSGTF